MNEFNLVGKRALVTGSSRGIGRSIALAFARQGADVVVHGHTGGTMLESVIAEANALAGNAHGVQLDLSEPHAARSLYDMASSALGGLDIIVSNVAVQFPAHWTAVTMEDFDKQVAINYRFAFELIQLVAPEMLRRKWGRVVTIGSVQEQVPHPEMIVYASLKSAQTAMVRNLAKQFAAKGVTVNNIAPGVIATDRSKERLVDENYRKKALGMIPSGYVGKPEDCVGAALLLCSDAGRYITGQNLFVDGGMSL